MLKLSFDENVSFLIFHVKLDEKNEILIYNFKVGGRSSPSKN